MTKRHLRRSKSLVSVMLWGGSEEFDSDKAKNVRQTEILVDLREAILQVARHFQSIDPKNHHVVCTFALSVHSEIFSCFFSDKHTILIPVCDTTNDTEPFIYSLIDHFWLCVVIWYGVCYENVFLSVCHTLSFYGISSDCESFSVITSELLLLNEHKMSCDCCRECPISNAHSLELIITRNAYSSLQ